MSAQAPVDLSAATAGRPLTDVTEAFSGARLELVELPDGRRIVLKHLPSEGDWLTRATDGSGRVRRLWESGLLARLRPLVDHTIIDVRSADGHDLVVMRDAAGDLLPRGSQATSRALLTRGAGRPPLADRIVHGWELFEPHVDHDVAAAVFAVHRDPEPLGRRLARFPSTLLHGDAKLENLGLSSHGLVAIDWGDLTGFGPREVDVAWFALKGTARIGCSPGEIYSPTTRRRRADPWSPKRSISCASARWRRWDSGSP
jgi:hypothetical protein